MCGSQWPHTRVWAPEMFSSKDKLESYLIALLGWVSLVDSPARVAIHTTVILPARVFLSSSACHPLHLFLFFF